MVVVVVVVVVVAALAVAFTQNRYNVLAGLWFPVREVLWKYHPETFKPLGVHHVWEK